MIIPIATRLLPLLAAAGLSSCVTLGGMPMVEGAVSPGQRTVVVVYAPPGPVMYEKDTNVMEAAKVVPGLGFILSATQSSRDREASEDLKKLLGGWDPVPLFTPILRNSLSAITYPIVFVSPQDAGILDYQLKEFNEAKDAVDWQTRYSVRRPDDPAPRDYAKLAGMRGSLVLEVDLAYEAPSDGEGYWTPTLSAVTRLTKVDGLVLVWRHEHIIEDKPGKRRAMEYRENPGDLLRKYEAMMPGMAQAISTGLSAELQRAAAR